MQPELARVLMFRKRHFSPRYQDNTQVFVSNLLRIGLYSPTMSNITYQALELKSRMKTIQLNHKVL